MLATLTLYWGHFSAASSVGLVKNTELAENCSLLFSLLKPQLLLFAYRGVRQVYQHWWDRNNRGWQPCQCENRLKLLCWRGRSPPLSS